MTRPKRLPAKLMATIARVDAWNAAQAHDRVSQITVYLTDARVSERKAAHQCRCCFYLYGGRGLAGQMFREWSCQICLEKQPTWHNTAVPKYCGPCADKHALCECCGGRTTL